MRLMRIIVCGCRDWRDTGAIECALMLERERAIVDWGEIVIVHGACPTGADRIADRFAKEYPVAVERHPASWKEHGKASGPIRNREMAQLGADVCLAFWDGKSRGTLDMITQATLAGIPVRICPKGRR